MSLQFLDVDQVISRKGIFGGEYIDLEVKISGFDDFKISSKKQKLMLNSVKNVMPMNGGGGEIATFVLLEIVLRLLPGVLGGNETLNEESFSDKDLLEYPKYTKPRDWNGICVPEVLTSGNHNEIKNWRDKQRIEITKSRKLDT